MIQASVFSFNSPRVPAKSIRTSTFSDPPGRPQAVFLAVGRAIC
jgi:hypothetical protein